ncbi:hypothetical protein C1645_871711 [Glomus cerebriforme]|uniref:Uncharacterized protein n=1 Tax=Glomus cerebriforme TaxID=658196 RepID=A0A397THL7_9GLOM|nr:hypothetical protein C1645_871711 [Glomus cerebriforme]
MVQLLMQNNITISRGCFSHEDFAVRFKNIKEIYEFIDLGKRIAILKETIDRSFQKHEELIKQEIRSNLQNWFPNDMSDKTDKIKGKCLELIEKELNDVPDCSNRSTNFMPNSGFSDYERKQKVVVVWNLLQNSILSRDDISVAKEIDKEVEEEYSNSDFYGRYKTNTPPDLSKHKAYKFTYKLDLRNMQFSQYIELKDLKVLQNKLDNLIDIIFKERASYYFYHGIVCDLKKEISKITPSTYLPEFKWNVHLYALLKFKPKMIKFQEWDKENTPLAMFDQKKDEYLKIIDTRLQYGLRLISEGHIVGDYLMKVIHKKQ